MDSPSSVEETKWAAARQNQQIDLCIQQRLGSASASAQSDQSLCFLHEETLGPRLPIMALGTQRRLWSDWADAQADPSLRWAHRSFCWFCRAPAQINGDSSPTLNFIMLIFSCWEHTCDLYRSGVNLPIWHLPLRPPDEAAKIPIFMNSDFSLFPKAKTCFPITTDACFV